MRCFVASLICVIVAVTEGFAQIEPEPRTADEVVKRLQGIWKVERSEDQGSADPAFLVDALPTITFHGNDFTWGDGQTGTIVAIDATRKPITIDYLYTSGPRKGEVDAAIIQFEGDTFTDCMPPRGGARPNQFSTRQGSGKTMLTYQRTTEERGPGSLLNPWFYLGICTTGVVVALLGALALIIFLVRLSRQPPSNDKRRNRPQRRRSPDSETD